MKIPKVGISQIGVAIPKYFISIEEIARHRKLSADYAIKGLGVLQARVPYDVSIEELAADALRKINYQDVRRFYVGTESDMDASKPFSVKIINREMGLTTIPFQYKFACLSGLEALISACEYSVANEGKPAVALAVDRSIYSEINPEAEMTQGCAAVALRVEMNPKLLIIDYQNLGQYAADIDDFRVPASSFPFPVIKGDLTKSSYLECQKRALADWEKNNDKLIKRLKKEKRTLAEFFDFIVMHTPFPKIVEWASAVLWRHTKLNKKEHLSLSDCVKNPSLFKEYKKEIDRIRGLSKFQDFFTKKVKPGLKYNHFIGNSYTSAVFISLIAVLEKVRKGEQIGISGYGGGASAVCIRGITTIKKKFKSDLEDQLKQGQKLTIKDYERWRRSMKNQS